ncbi:Hsp70 family protein [Streptomyces sp. NPDC049837]|uniref:Hsp70 family protein n=1 Tax=Streptomyces sp. NPDC049837 TaxID=3155277 RepID=UPI00342CD45B
MPAKRSVVFTTAEAIPAGDERPIVLHVYQGEHAVAARNHRLGTVELTGLPSAPRGAPRIEVTVDVDADGTVGVLAQDWETQKVWRMVSAEDAAPPREGIAVVEVVEPEAEAEQPENVSSEPSPIRMSAAAERDHLGGHRATYHAGTRGYTVPAVIATVFLVLAGVGLAVPNMAQVAVCGTLAAVFGCFFAAARYGTQRYAQLPLALAAVRRGETVSFGTISVSRDEVTAYGRSRSRPATSR